MMIAKNRLKSILSILDLSYLNKDWVTEKEIAKYLNCGDDESFFILEKLKNKYQLINIPMAFFINEFQINFSEERNERYHNAIFNFANN